MSLSGDVIDCPYQSAGSAEAQHQMELSGCPDKRRRRAWRARVFEESWGVVILEGGCRLYREVCGGFCSPPLTNNNKRRVKNKPLKFGLIRASYPDVRPISESRKSDGDKLEEDLESYSLASTSLKQTHRRGRAGARTHARHQIGRSRLKSRSEPHLPPSSVLLVPANIQTRASDQSGRN